MSDERDKIIMSLAERLYICSRLLTAAAERLHWEHTTVQELLSKLNKIIDEDRQYAGN